jgi:hypothetical protein
MNLIPERSLLELDDKSRQSIDFNIGLNEGGTERKYKPQRESRYDDQLLTTIRTGRSKQSDPFRAEPYSRSFPLKRESGQNGKPERLQTECQVSSTWKTACSRRAALPEYP